MAKQETIKKSIEIFTGNQSKLRIELNAIRLEEKWKRRVE